MVDKCIENSEIADLYQYLLQARSLNGVACDREDFGIGGLAPLGADKFGTGLIKLPVAAFTGRFISESGSDIAQPRFALRGQTRLVFWRLQLPEICPAGRNREFGSQTDFAAARIGKNIHAAANILARAVEEWRRTFENWRIDRGISVASERCLDSLPRRSQVGSVRADIIARAGNSRLHDLH
jgi:hypothetical protein